MQLHVRVIAACHVSVRKGKWKQTDVSSINRNLAGSAIDISAHVRR